jgi:hypothetical protein
VDVSLNGTARWSSAAARPALSAALVAQVEEILGPPLLQGEFVGDDGAALTPDEAAAAGKGFVHTVAYGGNGGLENEMLVLMATNFSWCVPGSAAKAPGAVAGFRLHLRTQLPVRSPRVTDELTSLTIPAFADGSGGWVLEVPTFTQFAAVSILIGE